MRYFLMTNKQKYREFCQTEKDIPIFSKNWWLDAVCGEDNWNVVIVEKDHKLLASLPYYKKQESIFNIITLPQLTQTMGVYIKYPKNQKYEKKLSYEKQVMRELIENLPHLDSFNQQFHYSITNWLPFYWKGFQQTTRYTYIIEDLKNIDLIWENLNNKTRTDIRKAEKHVKVISNDNIELFHQMSSMTFERQNLDMPYSIEFMKKLDRTCQNNNNRKIFFAIDENEQIHAAIYIVWDENSAYYLMGGGDPKLRNSGANHLLIWEAIKFASTVTKTFDFEGSMIEPIEKFFRSFGAVQKPYFQIYKTNSKLWKIKSIIDKMIKE